MRRLALLIILVSAVCAPPVRAERLVVSLSSNEIAIGSNYTGTQIVLFGIVERDDQSASRAGPLDVVITVRGPREGLTVRRKERLGPIWINRSQQKFVAVPAVLSVLTSVPLPEVASPDARTRLRIGLDAIVNAPELTFEPGRKDDPFRAALIRLKQREGLWSQDERGVVFVTPGFFRGRLALPATAPTGNYDVEILLLSGESLLARRNASFEVVKTGFEEQIATASQDRALGYGLLVAVLALGFGWVASVIFRRD